MIPRATVFLLLLVLFCLVYGDPILLINFAVNAAITLVFSYVVVLLLMAAVISFGVSLYLLARELAERVRKFYHSYCNRNYMEWINSGSPEDEGVNFHRP